MWGCVFVAGIVYDFQVAAQVMDEQEGRFAVGDLGKMSLYSDEKEKLGQLLSPNEGKPHIHQRHPSGV